MTLIVVLVLTIGSALAGILYWDRLPEMMASHWNANDQVDGYMTKFWGVFLMPLVTLGMFVLFLVVPAIDPLKANIAKFRETFNLFIAFITAFMVYIYALSLRWNLGYTEVGISKAMLPAMGLLFIIVGVMLRKAQRNFFIGIRTPWTLSSDSVWNKTHQLGAILFMISGVITVVGGFIGGMTAVWMLLGPLFASTIFLVIYSYVLYQREIQA